MRRALAGLLLVSLAGACDRRGGPAPATPPSPSSPAPPTCDDAKIAAVAAWTAHRDRLAAEAIRAFADAVPPSIALVEAHVAYLEALAADAGSRAPNLPAALADLQGELAGVRRLADAPAPADVRAAEQRHLAVLAAARRLTQRVVHRRAAHDLKYVSEGDRARALRAALARLGEARLAALRRAGEAHTAWALAELAARRGGTDLAAARTTAEIVTTSRELLAARDANLLADRTCPEAHLTAPPAPAASGPGVQLGREQWRARVDSSRWVPLEDGGIVEVARTVVIGGPLGLEAFDPARGKSRWRREFVTSMEAGEGRFRVEVTASGAALWPRLVHDDAQIFAADLDGGLHAIDVRTGADRWRIDLAGGVASTPVLRDGTLYVGSRYGELVALSAEDGARKFTRMLGGVDRPLALEADLLIAADEDGFVVAVDVGTGDFAWMTRLPRPTEAGPLITGGLVLLADRDGELVALDLATGARRWTRDLAGEPASLVAHTDAVAFVGARGTITALNRTTGEPRWRTHYPYSDPPGETFDIAVRNAPTRAGDHLLLALGYPSALVALDLRSGLAVSVEAGPDGSTLMTPMTLGDGRAYVFTAQNNLVAYGTTPLAAK